MTDMELMLMAAKAADVPAYLSTDGTIQMRPVLVIKSGGGMGTMPHEEQWNPLNYDRDAFQLAVGLRIDIEHNHPVDHEPWVSAERKGLKGYYAPVLWVEEGFDETQRLAATRRVIVSAAAAIWQGLSGHGSSRE